jgi:tetratricopeptide (TPR) repeat protein
LGFGNGQQHLKVEGIIEMFNRWIKRRSEGALDELCKITKNNLERFELKRAKGDRHMKFDSEPVKSWDRENQLLKRVLKEKWAKEQIEQQLNKMTGAELVDLLNDGLALKIFKFERPEEPKLEIFMLKMPSVDIIGQEKRLRPKISDKEIKLIESERLYLCDYVGLSQLADCALVYLYQKVGEKINERVSKGELKSIERKLKARGVKFFLFVSPDVSKEDQPDWSNLLVDKLPIFFDNVSIYYDSSMTVPEPPKKKIMVIKIFCPDAKFGLKLSEAGAFYGKLCDNYMNFVSKSLAKNKFELLGCQFDLVFRMHPPEDPTEFIPLNITIPAYCGRGKRKWRLIWSDSANREPPLLEKWGVSREDFEKQVSMLKDTKLDMKTIETLAEEYPDDPYYQGIKSPAEWKWRCLALHASMRGDYEKAIEYANKGLEINPESAYLFFVRGRSKGDIGKFGKFKGGIKDLDKALKLEPKFSEAFEERGYIKQKMGDIKGAEEDYKKAREIEPFPFLTAIEMLEKLEGLGEKLERKKSCKK